MTPPALPKSIPERLSFAGLLLLLFWLPLPWGSHRPWAEHLFVFCTGLLFACACLARLLPWQASSRLASRHWWGAGLWLLWLGWIALQLVPLPAAQLAALSPSAAAIHAAVPGGPLNSISIAPAATAEALLLSLGYFLLYCLIVALCRDRSRQRLVAATLVLAGFIQAVYGSLMTLSGAEIGFLVHKTHYLGFATGTFVNRNHLGGFLELTGAAGVGLVVADLRGGGTAEWRLRLTRWIDVAFSTKARVRIALSVIVIGLVLTRSRMGNTAFFVALSVTGLGYLALRERRLFFPALALFASLLLIDTLIVSRWFGLEQVVERIQTTHVEQEERLLVYARLPPVIDAYRRSGSGLGSFAQAFEPYRTPEILSYFDHAHNDYFEFLIETGVPGLGLLLLLVGAHVGHALRVIWRRHDRLPQGICLGFLMATIALGLHMTVEFNFQIPAIAAGYVVLMGLAASCSARSGRSGRKTPPQAAADGPEVG